MLHHLHIHLPANPQENCFQVLIVHFIDNRGILIMFVQMIQYHLTPCLTSRKLNIHIPFTFLDDYSGMDEETSEQGITGEEAGVVLERLVLDRVQKLKYGMLDTSQDFFAPTLYMRRETINRSENIKSSKPSFCSYH